MRISKYFVAKYLLIFVNLSYALLGAAMLAIGLAQKESMSGFLGVFVGGVTLWAPMVLICTGTVLFTVAVLGSLATLSENYWALIWFGAVLSCTILVQSVAGAASLFISGHLPNYIRTCMRYEILNYENDPSLLDTLQLNMGCCGGFGPSDWSNVTGCIPISCCPIKWNPTERDQLSSTEETIHETEKPLYETARILHYWPQTQIPSLYIGEGRVRRHYVEHPDMIFGANLRSTLVGTTVTTTTDKTGAKTISSDVDDVQGGGESTATPWTPLLNWSDFLYRSVNLGGDSEGEELWEDSEKDAIDVSGEYFIHNRAEPVGNYIANFCYQEERYCKLTQSLSMVPKIGCTGLIINAVSNDSMFAGVSTLVMASLELVGLPLCVFMAAVIKEEMRQAYRRELF